MNETIRYTKLISLVTASCVHNGATYVDPCRVLKRRNVGCRMEFPQGVQVVSKKGREPVRLSDFGKRYKVITESNVFFSSWMLCTSLIVRKRLFPGKDDRYSC
jgi:hypothetical protein